VQQVLAGYSPRRDLHPAGSARSSYSPAPGAGYYDASPRYDTSHLGVSSGWGLQKSNSSSACHRDYSTLPSRIRAPVTDAYRYSPSPSRDDTSLESCTSALRRRRQASDKYVLEDPAGGLGSRFQRRRNRPRDGGGQPTVPPRTRQRPFFSDAAGSGLPLWTRCHR